MAQKKTTIKLHGETYELTQLLAVEAYDLYNELISAIGGKLRERLRETIGRDKLDPTEVGLLVYEFKSVIPRQLMRELREAFVSNTRVKKGSVFLPLSEGDIFDQHFSGRMRAIDEWMIACAKHSFLGFLSEGDSSSPHPETTESA